VNETESGPKALTTRGSRAAPKPKKKGEPSKSIPVRRKPWRVDDPAAGLAKPSDRHHLLGRQLEVEDGGVVREPVGVGAPR